VSHRFYVTIKCAKLKKGSYNEDKKLYYIEAAVWEYGNRSGTYLVGHTVNHG